jgi:hypothetical protein
MLREKTEEVSANKIAVATAMGYGKIFLGVNDAELLARSLVSLIASYGKIIDFGEVDLSVKSFYVGMMRLLVRNDAFLEQFVGRQLAIAHGAQFPAERLLGDGDADLFEYPLCQVNQPPANHAMNRRNRAALDDPGDRLALAVIKLGGLAWRLSIQQTFRALRVEP